MNLEQHEEDHDEDKRMGISLNLWDKGRGRIMVGAFFFIIVVKRIY